MTYKNNTFLSMTILFIFLGLILVIPPNHAYSQALKDIYATGSVRFKEEMVIDESALPEGRFFEGISDLALDHNGNLYLCDMRACNIKKFSSEGKFLKIIGKKGQGPGEFNMPSRMAVSGNRLFVFDVDSRRLCCLTTEGEHIKCIIIQYTEGLPRHIQALPNGDILIMREVNYFQEKDKPQDIIIHIYSPELEQKKTLFKYPVLRNIYRNIDGMFTNIIQPFSPYVYMSTAPNGRVIIGLSKDYTIQVHNPEKGLIFSFEHPYDPVKVTPQDKETFFSGITFSIDQTRSELPEKIKKLTQFPRHKPAFDSLLVDDEGNILIHPIQKNSKDSPLQFDAFTPQGQFIGTMEMKGIEHFPRTFLMDKGFAWIIEWDPEGMPRVVKYKMAAGE
ncbi:MAG: hypothetical protein GF421_00160 [Candidatus Aminicenantes bacterium]|nr:hypothetical protein [Candidatus Aminicenantes bacterium]